MIHSKIQQSVALLHSFKMFFQRHSIFLFLLPILVSGALNYSSCEQAKKPKMLKNCCNIPKEDKISRTCRKALLSQNITTTNNSESRNLKSDKVALHACIAECVFKTNGYLLSNGSLNIAVIQNSLKTRYKNDATLSDLMLQGLNSCISTASKRAKQFEWLHTKGECDYYPATLLACTMEQVYENCPASRWNTSSDCDTMRKYLIACDAVQGKK